VPVQRFTLLLLALFSINAFAQNKPVQASRLMSIAYGSPSWNTDSTKIDSAYLILRDKATNKIVQIQLEETEPDSSEFKGHFSVNIGESDTIMPEIFVPLADLRHSDKSNKKLYELIQSNKLPRKPVIWKKNERGQSVLDVYDTREQAEAALKAYQNEQALAKEAKTKQHSKATPSDAALAAARQAERQAQLEQLAIEAAKRETDRVRMEQIERQKALERLRQSQAASAKERAERKARAKKIGDEALVLYERGEYPQAEIKFKESVELDPENNSYYFQYGITLYRNEKYNDALVVFKLTKGDAKTQLEKSYYMGLTFYRLSELQAALEQFENVANSKEPMMAPSARFYEGVIYFAMENYTAAKNSFETVIDTSSDPRLDEQAESYLDRIAGAMAFQKLRENKFTFMGIVGAMYDSNVLLAPDSSPDQGAATNVADLRLLTIGDLEYRGIFTQKHEWSAKANASLTNSLKDEAAAADPFMYNLSLPYSYKGILGKKGVKFTVKPGYEMLFMASDGSSTKTSALNSYFTLFEGTWVMSQEWFSTYSFEYRGDDSKVASASGPEDADAAKYSLRTSQTVFLDKGRKQALIGSLGYVLNAAKGDNKKFNRIEAGATFVKPVKWEASWNLSLNIYKVEYPDDALDRGDFNLTLSSGISKPVKEWLIWGVQGSYTKNDSTVSNNEYSKYTILTTATYITNF